MPTYDTIIVGGGLLGKAVALAVANTGRKVAVIYQREQQGQASAAAGAMLGVFSEINPHDLPAHQQRDVAYRWAARTRYAAWVAALTETTGCSIDLRAGLFVLANPAGDDDRTALQAIRAATTWHAAQAETVNPAEVPGIAAERGCQPYDAVFLPDEGSIDTAQLLAALDAALEQQPTITIYTGRVTKLRLVGERDCAVEFAGATVQAETVVLAGGVEIAHLLAESSLPGVAIPPLLGGRGVSLLIRSTAPFPYAVRTPNRGFACGLHVVPRAGSNQLYLGATNRLTTSPDLERGATLGEMNTLLQGSMRELHTRFNSAELVRVNVGYRPLTPDHLPLVGRTADPRILLATGTYRNGVLLAPLIADLIAEELTTPGWHASHPFSPQRTFPVGLPAALDTWLRQGSHSLLTTVLEPGGTLSNGHDQNLEALLYVTFNLLLNPAYQAGTLRSQMQRLIARAPIEEVFPSLFDLLARQAAPPGSHR